jgi:hypothetical protein
MRTHALQPLGKRIGERLFYLQELENSGIQPL